MTVHVVVENVDLGYHIHSVWTSASDANEAARILRDAWRLTYPEQDWKYKYLVLDFEVRTGVHTLTSPPLDASQRDSITTNVGTTPAQPPKESR